MHLLPATTVTLDEIDRAVDLAIPAGDVVVLSFSDNDLAALASAEAAGLDLRLASLRRLKHPLSVDLLVQTTIAGSRFVIIRCLGGLDYWRYGLEQVQATCRACGIGLCVLPGDDREDPRLRTFSTISEELETQILALFRAGGVENMSRLMSLLRAHLDGCEAKVSPLVPPAFFAWQNGRTMAPLDALALLPSGPLALVLVYRASLLSGDCALPEALEASLAKQHLVPLVLAVTSLKDPAAATGLAAAIAARKPAVIVATTAFSARDGDNFVLDRADCPILQAVPVGSARSAWEASARGLSALDLAMQLALPEFDGRLGGIPVAFKEQHEAGGFTIGRFVPHDQGIAHIAACAARWAALAEKPAAQRRLALVMTDYPARGGRAGFAVGLDTPASVAAIQATLCKAGYETGDPIDPAGLMSVLQQGDAHLVMSLDAYRDVLDALPPTARAALAEAHGAPENDPAFDNGAFRFPIRRAGHLLVALQPARDPSPDRKAAYHDPDVPPGHGTLAFYAALTNHEAVDALIHLGTHGTTEWLPGKAVALSGECWPRLVLGALPVVYPYVVDDPGEAAPAKRRLGAVVLGHLPPPLMTGDPEAGAGLLRDLVQEYSEAQILDPRRAGLIAREILSRAETMGLAGACGVDGATPMDEALTRLDAHLCDLAEMPLRAGLHVFGSAGHEAAHLLRALHGRFVPPGPSGSPHRGRPDVVPTGRNLVTLDPRAIPTRAATALGAAAAKAVIARHLQDEGDYPRRIVMDLWASPTLRSGGEDLAHALALMGVTPAWDAASTRVTGFTITPQPRLDHPRIDVTLRISGAFRDTFPDQIALFDAACRAVAAVDEDGDANALAAARRRGEDGARIFGPAPGRFGAGVADKALDTDWQERATLGETYLASASHAYGGPAAAPLPSAAFGARVAAADAFVHVCDTPGRDILEAASAADLIGGFAAAAETLGARPASYSLDTSNPEAPRARTLAEDLSRIVHGRLANPRWIAGQLAHGWRGAAELAEALDSLFVFAATSEAVPDGLFDTVFTAWIADSGTRTALQAANGPAYEAIRRRFAEARRRGLWVSRINSTALLDGEPEGVA